MDFRYTDMTGRSFSLPHHPKRIVSLVPSQTELLFDLGLDNEVVGITKFCVHPDNWFRTKTRVGGTKNVNLKRLADLQPDLVIANKEENVQAQIEAIREFCPVWTSDIKDLNSACQMISDVGELTGRQESAMGINARISNAFQNLEKGPEHKVLYLIWFDPWMTAGGDTFINNIISAAGWQNVMSEHSRYPAMDETAIKNCGANLILLSSEPYPFREKHAAAIRTLLPDANVLFVDGEMFSWYGSRLLLAPTYFQSLHDQILK